MAMALQKTWTGVEHTNAFLDYKSAFNTIQPGKLIEKLVDLGVPSSQPPPVTGFRSFLLIGEDGNFSAELTI